MSLKIPDSSIDSGTKSFKNYHRLWVIQGQKNDRLCVATSVVLNKIVELEIII